MVEKDKSSNTNLTLPRTDPQILKESKIKRARVREWLQTNDYDSLIICRRENFSWLTTGGDPSVVNTTQNGIGCMVITQNNHFLVSHTMDGQRLIDEQIPDQNFELLETHWFDGDCSNTAKKVSGNRIAADLPLRAVDYVFSEISNLHYPMSTFEFNRLRWMGQTMHEIYIQMEEFIQPGMSERKITAEFLYQQASKGIESDVLITGSDERVEKYRHPMPTNKKIKKLVMLHSAARRWGLHAPITRIFSIGEPNPKLQNAFEAVSYIQARTFHWTKPEMPYADILNMQKKWYSEAGFKGEWKNHFQGGPTGYIIVNATNCLSNEVVKPNTPFEWFISVPGAKVAELTLLVGNNLEIVSNGDGWPQHTICFDGITFQTPGIFEI